MKKPRKNTENWKQRIVCFLVSDVYHAVTLINITMPVRVKERTDKVTVYEGPIETMWEKRVSPRINKSNLSEMLDIYVYDLVGVLIASSDYLDTGTINWLVQSDVIGATQAGADRIKQVA